MPEEVGSFAQLSISGRRLLGRALAIAGNRLELFALEMQEEREHLLLVSLLAMGVLGLALLSSMTITAAIVMLFWSHSPVLVLLSLTGCYFSAAMLMYLKLSRLMRNRQRFPSSIDQLRKDRVSFEEIFK